MVCKKRMKIISKIEKEYSIIQVFKYSSQTKVSGYVLIIRLLDNALIIKREHRCRSFKIKNLRVDNFLNHRVISAFNGRQFPSFVHGVQRFCLQTL